MKLEAGWVIGFVDGEGCFYVGINRQAEMTLGYQVLPEFTVIQHKRDVQLLHALKAFFGCGVVRTNHGDRMAYRVRGTKQLIEHIVPFFDEHPLKSKKKIDYLKFRSILLVMVHSEHLTPEGLAKIREIAGEMNRGSEGRAQPSGKPDGTY